LFSRRLDRIFLIYSYVRKTLAINIAIVAIILAALCSVVKSIAAITVATHEATVLIRCASLLVFSDL
ncbi:hypothetical protein ACFL6S_35160, partial [Candidatus Poribacteria bacterium]